MLFQGVTSEVVDRVYKEYMGDAESPAQVRDGLLDALGDVYFVISSVEVARSHRGTQQLQNCCSILSGGGVDSVQHFSLSRELVVVLFNQNSYS